MAQIDKIGIPSGGIFEIWNESIVEVMLYMVFKTHVGPELQVTNDCELVL